MATTTRQARTVRRVTAGPRYANRPAMRAEERGETALQPSDGRFRERTRVRAHAWDAGIFFSVMLLLAIGLVALFSASLFDRLLQFQRRFPAFRYAAGDGRRSWRGRNVVISQG